MLSTRFFDSCICNFVMWFLHDFPISGRISNKMFTTNFINIEMYVGIPLCLELKLIMHWFRAFYAFDDVRKSSPVEWFNCIRMQMTNKIDYFADKIVIKFNWYRNQLNLSGNRCSIEHHMIRWTANEHRMTIFHLSIITTWHKRHRFINKCRAFLSPNKSIN